MEEKRRGNSYQNTGCQIGKDEIIVDERKRKSYDLAEGKIEKKEQKEKKLEEGNDKIEEKEEEKNNEVEKQKREKRKEILVEKKENNNKDEKEEDKDECKNKTKYQLIGLLKKSLIFFKINFQ